MATPEYIAPPFRYFFTGVSDPSPDGIPAAWRHRFGRDSAHPPFRAYDHAKAATPGLCCTLATGPEGKPGLMAAPYHLPTQHWRAALAYDRAAILDEVQVEPGVWIIVSATFDPYQIMRHPPLIEADASRLRHLKFTSKATGISLGWYIPCCLPASNWCLVPMHERYELGAWHRVPMPAYRDIAAIAERYYKAECGEPAADGTIGYPPLDWMRTATCEAFAVNYEITPAELGALGVLDDATYLAVAGLLTDREARTAERAARAHGQTTVRARQSTLWRAGQSPDYVPTATDLDLAADTLPAVMPPVIGKESTP